MDLILEARSQGKTLQHEAKSDSQYAKGMLALAYKIKKNHELIACVEGKIAKVCEYNEVFIHCIAGHSKIAGNEQADELAMRGALNSKAGVYIVHPTPDPPAPTTAPAPTATPEPAASMPATPATAATRTLSSILRNGKKTCANAAK